MYIYVARLSKLLILQNRAVRVVAGIKKCEQSGPYFVKFGLLRFDQIRELQIGEFSTALNMISSLQYLEVTSSTPLQFVHTPLEIIPVYRPVSAHTKARRFTIKSDGTPVWNNIPSAIVSPII